MAEEKRNFFAVGISRAVFVHASLFYPSIRNPVPPAENACVQNASG